MDPDTTSDTIGYLSLLKNGNLDESKTENDRFSDMELGDISQLDNTMTILRNDTVKRRLRHMITSNQGSSMTIENVISRNNKRSSCFPDIFKTLTDCMIQNMIHSVVFSSSPTPLPQLASQPQPTRSTINDKGCNKIFLDLSNHTSRIPARVKYNIYSQKIFDSSSDTNFQSSTIVSNNMADYFLFGFSPETELLKNLIAVINVIASLFVSSINLLEYDIQKRNETLCQPGHEMEYAQMLKDLKQLNSASAATLNFIRNIAILPFSGNKSCSCCGSKSHTQSPLVDSFRKSYNGVASTKKQDNILIPPEIIFQGIKNEKKTPSCSTKIQMKTKSNRQINSVIKNQIKSTLANMRDMKYKQKYHSMETPLTLTELKSLPAPDEIKQNIPCKNKDDHFNHQTTGISSLEPRKIEQQGIVGDTGSTTKYLDMRDYQQRREISNYVKYNSIKD
uniref:Wsv131-like protein n=1 Tax=Melicertus latisulcatus majanivirus TaxID=2984277 RepID=A0A9C7F6R2_9VIRU|nr:MAG: wsv131-like protein [Melicertus latisulcatus majanivirus]